MNSVKFTFTWRKRLIKKFHGVICDFISCICVNLVLHWVCVYCVWHVFTYVYVFWEYHVACNTHELLNYVFCFLNISTTMWIFLLLHFIFNCNSSSLNWRLFSSSSEISNASSFLNMTKISIYAQNLPRGGK